jgi:hypothetical protein
MQTLASRIEGWAHQLQAISFEAQTGSYLINLWKHLFEEEQINANNLFPPVHPTRRAGDHVACYMPTWPNPLDLAFSMHLLLLYCIWFDLE